MVFIMEDALCKVCSEPMSAGCHTHAGGTGFKSHKKCANPKCPEGVSKKGEFKTLCEALEYLRNLNKKKEDE